MHNDESILYFATFMLFILMYQISREKKEPIITVLLSISAFFFIVPQWFNLANLDGVGFFIELLFPGLSGSYENLFKLKVLDFLSTYTIPTLCMTIIGIIYALKSKNRNEKMILLTFIVIVVVFFMPEYQAFRLYQSLATFMTLILVIGIAGLFEMLLSIKTRRHRINRAYIAAISMIVFVVMIPATITPTVNLASRLTNQNDPYSYSTIADYEYELAFWIKNNIHEHVMIVSDFRTMLLISSLANTIWLTGKGMSGLESGDESIEAMQIIKEDVFGSNNTEVIYDAIMTLLAYIHPKERYYMNYTGVATSDLEIVVILTSRTASWLEQDGLYDEVFAQYSEIPEFRLVGFNNQTYFEELYQIDSNAFVWRCLRR